MENSFSAVSKLVAFVGVFFATERSLGDAALESDDDAALAAVSAVRSLAGEPGSAGDSGSVGKPGSGAVGLQFILSGWHVGDGGASVEPRGEDLFWLSISPIARLRETIYAVGRPESA